MDYKAIIISIIGVFAIINALDEYYDHQQYKQQRQTRRRNFKK